MNVRFFTDAADVERSERACLPSDRRRTGVVTPIHPPARATHAPHATGLPGPVGAPASLHAASTLQAKLRHLARTIGALAARRDAEQLIAVVHRSGWTTTGPEAVLLHGMLDHLQARVDELERACDTVLVVALEVGGSPASV